jgi:hypothetical protein
MAFRWHRRNTTPEVVTIKDVYKLFYLNFLKVPIEDCEIVEMTDEKLVTRCKNKCPILDFSQMMNIDTKKSCKKVSEGPCKFFLRKLDKNIFFKRNYNHIRPYFNNCEETIILKNKK